MISSLFNDVIGTNILSLFEFCAVVQKTTFASENLNVIITIMVVVIIILIIATIFGNKN